MSSVIIFTRLADSKIHRINFVRIENCCGIIAVILAFKLSHVNQLLEMVFYQDFPSRERNGEDVLQTLEL